MMMRAAHATAQSLIIAVNTLVAMKYKLLIPACMQDQFERKVQELSKALRTRKNKHKAARARRRKLPKEPDEVWCDAVKTDVA